MILAKLQLVALQKSIFFLRILIIILFTLLCCKVTAQPKTIKLRPLDGYFILNDKEIQKKTNCIVITNRRDFQRLFGSINKPDTPDFNKEIVVVLALPPAHKQSKIWFERALIKAGNFIEVYCGLQRNVHSVPYKSYPIVAAALPRSKEITYVNFYNEKDMKLIESVKTTR